MRTLFDIGQRALDFDTGITANHTQPRARCIQENTIKPIFEHFAHLSSIIGTGNHIFDSEPMHVGDRRLLSFGFEIVGNQHTGISHELCHVTRLTAWCSRHVQDLFFGLWRERQNRTHGCGTLEHVHAAQIFGCGSNRYRTFHDFETHLGPRCERVQEHLENCHFLSHRMTLLEF